MDELHRIVGVAQFRRDLDLDAGFRLKAAALELFDARRADGDAVLRLDAGLGQGGLKRRGGQGVAFPHAGADVLDGDGVVDGLVAYHQFHGGLGAAVKRRDVVEGFRLEVLPKSWTKVMRQSRFEFCIGQDLTHSIFL